MYIMCDTNLLYFKIQNIKEKVDCRYTAGKDMKTCLNLLDLDFYKVSHQIVYKDL